MSRYEGDVTPAVLAVMAATSDPRLREIMVSLVKHLHGFVSEVQLSEAEFREATAIINQIGKLSNDAHNEAVLMAGTLGVSSLVCLLNNGDKGANRNRSKPAWPILANALAIHGERRHDRQVRYGGPAAVCQWAG